MSPFWHEWMNEWWIDEWTGSRERPYSRMSTHVERITDLENPYLTIHWFTQESWRKTRYLHSFKVLSTVSLVITKGKHKLYSSKTDRDHLHQAQLKLPGPVTGQTDTMDLPIRGIEQTTPVLCYLPRRHVNLSTGGNVTQTGRHSTE